MTDTDRLLSNADVIIGQEELVERIAAGKRLKVKFGVDPTRPDLTFGHLVVLNKLRQFQGQGHEAILLIGDYTARIGDPSGRSALRPELTPEEVETNAATYLEQAFRILDESQTTVRRNSEWFEGMNFGDALQLTRKMTVARMLERDDFSKRYKDNTPISIVEFLYPLVQGHDSVELQADVELGGSDQLFNMLVGRALQKDASQPEQAVITLPLLVGLDGSRKMSKSYDNYVAFNDSPKDMFGKIMSIPDDVMPPYHALLLLTPEEEIRFLKDEHPMQAKKDLAQRLTAKFHGDEAAMRERQQFEQVFSRRENPEDMPAYSWGQLAGDAPEATLLDLLAATGSFGSKGEARRLVTQGAVKINDEKRTDPFLSIPLPEDDLIVRAGKRVFFKIKGK